MALPRFTSPRSTRRGLCTQYDEEQEENTQPKAATKRRLEFNLEENTPKLPTIKRRPEVHLGGGNIGNRERRWRFPTHNSRTIFRDDDSNLKDYVSDHVIEMKINLWTFNLKRKHMVKQKTEFLQNFCALKNSGGGIIRIQNLDKQNAEFADNFWSSIGDDVEKMPADFESSEGYESRKNFYRKTSRSGSYMDIFVTGSHVVCSTNLHVLESFEYRNYGKKEKYTIHRLHASTNNSDIPCIYSRVRERLVADETYHRGESSSLQFKHIKGISFESSFKENIPKFTSSFSEEGGSILYGIEEVGKQNKVPTVRGLEIDDMQQVQKDIEHVIKSHTSWFQRNDDKYQNSKEVEIFRLEDPSAFFKVFFHEVSSRSMGKSKFPLYVIEISIGSFPGVVCSSSKGPESFRINQITGQVERISPEEVLQLLSKAKSKKDQKESKFLHRFQELKMFKGIPSQTRIYEIRDSITEIGKRFSREYFGPNHLLQDNYVAKILKEVVEEKFKSNLTGLAVLHRELGSMLSRQVDKPRVCENHCLLDLFIFNTDLQPTFVTLDSGSCCESTCKHQILKYNNSSSTVLRYKLSEYFADGIYLLKGCILPNTNASKFKLTKDDVREGFENILSRGDIYPVEMNKSFDRLRCERLRDAFTINMIKIPSDLCNQIGEEFLNLLTPRQYEILHDRIQDKCHFIQGVPGTGKTVIAICFIEAVQRETNCHPDEVLYFTENATVCEVIRRKTCCRTLTYFELRKVHSVLKDTSIRNVIIDDAQLIVKHKDNFKWYTLLKNAVKQKDGYLWTFYGDHKYSSSSDCGLPKRIKNPVKLESIIRSSNRMVNDAKKMIRSPQYKGASVAHDFDGEGILSTKEFSNVKPYEVADKLRSILYSLLFEENNYSVDDIAILFHEYEDIPECFRCGQNIPRAMDKNSPYHARREWQERMEVDDEPYWSSEEEVKVDEREDLNPIERHEKELFRQGYDYYYNEGICTRELTISNGKKINICSSAFNDLNNHVVVDTVKRYASLDKLYVIHVNYGNLDDGKKYISYTRAISTTFEITVARSKNE